MVIDPLLSEPAEWFELKSINILDEKIESVADDQIVSQHVKSKDSEICDKQIVPVPIGGLKVADSSTYYYALSTLGYMVWPAKIMWDVLYTCYDVVGVKGIYPVVDLCTPKGFTGTIISTSGSCLGSYFGIQYAEFVSRSLISKTMAVACQYMAAGSYTEKLLQAGAYALWAPPAQTGIVIVCGFLGSACLVMIGNSVYKLMTDKPEHKELIEEWRKAGLKIKEGQLELSDPIIEELDDEEWGLESTSDTEDPVIL